ncbi:MAG: NUMOD3 domain-containing DNA-binding protein [archaeon]|nr:NUMOD3 domain-containing DNA-binding protein [archaeon]
MPLPKGFKHSDESKLKNRLSNLGKKRSEETKLKMSLKRKGENNGMFGKHHSEETRIKIGLIHKGKKLSEEHKKKLSEFLKGNTHTKGKRHSEETRKKMCLSHKGENNHLFGKHHTEETRKKISCGNKGKTSWNKGKKLSEETKRKIKIYRSKQVVPIKDTSIEVKLQKFLKELNINFIPHKYINQIKHAYQCDIFVPQINLVIEADGDYFHKFPHGKDVDHIRTKELIDNGFKVLRLWENEIREMDVNNFNERLNMVMKIG